MNDYAHQSPSNYAQVLQAVEVVLRDHLQSARMGVFTPEARLNQDLYLDSVLLMQLLVLLESRYQLRLPDEVIAVGRFERIDDLVKALLGRNDQALVEPLAPATDGTDFEDIKVHCFVSCLCEIVKASPQVDHRPFYFGVWDADVVVTENNTIAYHTEGLTHDFFRYWFQRLYGVEVKAWYDPSQSKGANIRLLIDLIEDKAPTQHIMVMLDLFCLPERENKYNQNPFPHYVLLEKGSDPSRWRMLDHDFRWQGEISKPKIFSAIESPAVAGGYHFDSRQITGTSNDSVAAYFQACMKFDHNPMTAAVRHIVGAHHATCRLDQLATALHHLPVLAIRKYAYEHGFAYFWRQGLMVEAQFEAWCVRIERLVTHYKRIHYLSIKLATVGDDRAQQTSLLDQIEDLLDEQDCLEFTLKQQLQRLFERWQAEAKRPPRISVPTGAVE